jgi:hypothetical protein
LEENLRRLYRKHHFIATYYWKLIVAQEATRGTAHDSPVLRVNLDKMEETEGTLSADKAYFARINCVKAESKGLRPYIMPEGEPNMRGPRVFKDMVRMHHSREEEFDEVYHTRSIAETIIERVKQRTGEVLFSIREDLQDLELRLKGIVNNLLAVNLMKASEIVGELPLLPV